MIKITITQILKTTKPGSHLKPLELMAYTADKELCIVSYLREYLSRTSTLRSNTNQLFISFQKPYNPVTKDTVSRWVKKMLKESGIDSDKFSVHSCRSASASATKSAGLTLIEIIKAASGLTAILLQNFMISVF